MYRIVSDWIYSFRKYGGIFESITVDEGENGHKTLFARVFRYKKQENMCVPLGAINSRYLLLRSGKIFSQALAQGLMRTRT